MMNTDKAISYNLQTLYNWWLIRKWLHDLLSPKATLQIVLQTPPEARTKYAEPGMCHDYLFVNELVICKTYSIIRQSHL